MSLPTIRMYCSILFGIFCKITINSDYNQVFIRNSLQNYNKFRLSVRITSGRQAAAGIDDPTEYEE